MVQTHPADRNKYATEYQFHIINYYLAGEMGLPYSF